MKQKLLPLLRCLALALPLVAFAATAAAQDNSTAETISGRIQIKGKFGLADANGHAIGECKYTVMEPYADTDNWLVCLGGNRVDGAKSTAQDASMAAIARRVKGSALYPVKGGKWGVISPTGATLIKPEYEALSDPLTGAIFVCQGGKWGFYSEQYQPLLKPAYQYIGAFNSLGLCWVRNGCKFENGVTSGGKMTVVNRSGQPVIPIKFANVSTFAAPNDSAYSSRMFTRVDLRPFVPDDGVELPYLWFTSEGKTKPGIMTADGQLVVPEGKYDGVYLPTDGMAKFYVNEGKKKGTAKWGFYDLETKKEIFTDPGFVYFPFRGGTSLAMRRDSALFYLVDKKFEEVSERYTRSCFFAEDYCVVGRGGKYGAIDRSGREVVPLAYEDMNRRFTEGFVGAKKDGKWGFVDSEGKTVVPFAYQGCGSYQNGVTAVRVNGLWGIIDRKGDTVVPIKWLNLKWETSATPEYYFAQNTDSLYYYYDVAQGKTLWPAQGKGFNKIEVFNGRSYVQAMQDGKWGAVLRSGEVKVPFAFTRKGSVDKAVFYLEKNSLTAFTPASLRRYAISLDSKCNTHTLGDVIPAAEWDY